MISYSARWLFAAMALAFTLSAVEAQAARGARPARQKQRGAAVTRGVGPSHLAKRQVRPLRPRKAKKPAVAAKKPRRVAPRTAPRRIARTRSEAAPPTGLGPFSIVQSFTAGVVGPAEALIGQITASIVKYGLKVKEHNPFTNEIQTVAMSQVDEVRFGARLVDHVVPSMGVPLTGRPMEQYLDGVLQRLVVANGLDRLTPYRFKVHLVYSDTVNAFAAPGGRIIVTTGILHRMKSEANIAAILAHEIGHVVARHSSQNLARGELVKDLLTTLGLAAGNNPQAQGAVIQGARELKSMMMSFSREQEHQSDSLGVRFLARAGYSARGLDEMAGFLAELDGGSVHDHDPDASHPSPTARTHVLARVAREVGITYQGDHGADRFALAVSLPLAFNAF